MTAAVSEVRGAGRRSEIGKLKVDLETRKRAVAELSKLKADMKRSGHVSAAEAASLRRSLAQREDELSRMRRASAEPLTPGRVRTLITCVG